MADIERVQIRCVLVGSAASGKSTFARSAFIGGSQSLAGSQLNGNASADYSMTSRMTVHRKSYLQANNHLQVDVSFVDCPGKELYQPLVEDICKRIGGAKCFVVAIFDVTNRASLAPVESLLTWFSKQQQSQNGKSAEQQFGILVANKIDLVDKRIVSPAEGQQKAKMLKLRYFECSALNDVAVQDFDQLLLDMVQTNLAPAGDIEQRNGPSQPATATTVVKALDAK